MFDGKRYATTGITVRIPNFMQNLVWFLIETMDVECKNHLQVIELSKKLVQTIIHEQEQPPYRKEHIIPPKTLLPRRYSS